jgi:putative ABC transport system ATP-binding protein
LPPSPSRHHRLRLEQMRSQRVGPLSLGLQAGTCLAITGPSGAGKSLLLRTIADLDANNGEAWVDERARSGMDGPSWRREVMYVAAEAGWWHDRVGPHFEAPPIDLVARLGLAPSIFDRHVHNCSTGERQRLGLLRALVRRPPVLLLDEPTGPLDAETTERVEAVLRERLQDGTTILLVTHDAAQARRLGTCHGYVAEGRLHLT